MGGIRSRLVFVRDLRWRRWNELKNWLSNVKRQNQKKKKKNYRPTSLMNMDEKNPQQKFSKLYTTAHQKDHIL